MAEIEGSRRGRRRFLRDYEIRKGEEARCEEESGHSAAKVWEERRESGTFVF